MPHENHHPFVCWQCNFVHILIYLSWSSGKLYQTKYASTGQIYDFDLLVVCVHPKVCLLLLLFLFQILKFPSVYLVACCIHIDLSFFIVPGPLAHSFKFPVPGREVPVAMRSLVSRCSTQYLSWPLHFLSLYLVLWSKVFTNHSLWGSTFCVFLLGSYSLLQVGQSCSFLSVF